MTKEQEVFHGVVWGLQDTSLSGTKRSVCFQIVNETSASQELCTLRTGPTIPRDDRNLA